MIEEILNEDKNINSNADANSMKIWIKGYLSNLPTESMDEDLVKSLVKIASNAFYTTFVDDYDLEENVMGLETLSKFPRPIIDNCLNKLKSYCPNFFINEYINRFNNNYASTH